MRTNQPNRWTEKTHEGATAARLTPEQQLRRSLMSCMLWEDEFYEDGQEIAARIQSLIPLMSPEVCFKLAIEAREKMKLRHAPLWVAVAMAKFLPTHRQRVEALVERIVQRPDEMTELLSLYSLGRTETKKLNKLPNGMKRGLARAFGKFNEYQLAKWNRQGAIKLRDVLRLVHPKPINEEQSALWKRLLDGTLATPDTWEVALSAAKPDEKKAVWERLLAENKLGALALLRNLRNMTQAMVDPGPMRRALAEMKTERVLPFRFVAAAKHAPHLEPELEQAMFRCLGDMKKLPGRTVFCVDVSGSMGGLISAKSEMTRMDAACALAMLLREICEDAQVITFSDRAVQVPPRRGFALRDAIGRSQMHGGTRTRFAIEAAKKLGYDRLIVLTDEQSHTTIPAPEPGTKPYFINVASAKNGIGYGEWTHFDGWSEAICDYIAASEEQG